MKRAALATAGVAVVLVAAACAWWYDARTRPAAVVERVVDGLKRRQPGVVVEVPDGSTLIAVQPSGLSLTLVVDRVVDACRADRSGCSAAIARVLDDADRIDGAARAPDRTRIRPVIAGGGTPGHLYGYVTEPVIGALELRYAIVDGAASTFVTSAIADRLGVDRAALFGLARAALQAETGVALERVADTGPAAIQRVRSDGDPVASLVDPARMQAFAAQLGTTKLLFSAPGRGTLFIAAPAERAGFVAWLNRRRGGNPNQPDVGLYAYDVGAPADARLSVAGTAPP